MDEASARQMLLPRMAERRAAIQRWLRTSRVKSNRLAIVAVVAGALGALATAGPATGGTNFTDSVGAGLNLSNYSAVWQVLCVVGMLTSIVSAVIAGLQRHFDLASRVGAAENAAVELENVSALLEMGQIPVADAMGRYQQAVATVPFIDDGGGARPPMPGYPAPVGPGPGPGPGYGAGPPGPPPGPPGPMNQLLFPERAPGPGPGQGQGSRPGASPPPTPRPPEPPQGLR